MLKKIYLILAYVLIFNITLKADEVVKSETEKQVSVEEMTPAKRLVTKNTEMASVAVPEVELIEMAGYMAAKGEGIPALKLDDSSIAVLVSGLKEAIAGKKGIEDIPQESIQDALSQGEARANAVKTGSEEMPKISEDALRTLGFIIAEKSALTRLGFDSNDLAFISKGFAAGANPTDSGVVEKTRMIAFQEFMQKRIDEAQARAKAATDARIADGKAFFEKLSADPDIQKSKSGLYYKVLNPGAGEKPTMKDTVLVDYKGTLIDGTEFDSSYKRGKHSKFVLSEVASGLGEGLTKIAAGGKIVLYIPSKLGYGDLPLPSGIVRPGDTLIVECELLEINPE